jgi:hypothetical protein
VDFDTHIKDLKTLIEVVMPGAQPVGAGWLAKASADLTLMYQKDRFREQARSHKGIFLQGRADSRQDYVTPASHFKPANLNPCAIAANP